MFTARQSEQHLTEVDKGNLLIQAITDPAARQRAEQFVANHASFDIGSALVRDKYENPKILFGHQYESALKSDHYKDNRDDLIVFNLESTSPSGA